MKAEILNEMDFSLCFFYEQYVVKALNQQELLEISHTLTPRVICAIMHFL